MTCEKRDQDLLLLAHGELSLARRLLVQAHLIHCSSCRRRVKRLLTVSTALSTVLHSLGSVSWSPARSHTAFRMRLPMFLLFTSLCIISLFLCRSVSNIMTASGHNKTQRMQSSHSQPNSAGCAPDLPNDHCQ